MNSVEAENRFMVKFRFYTLGIAGNIRFERIESLLRARFSRDFWTFFEELSSEDFKDFRILASQIGLSFEMLRDQSISVADYETTWDLLRMIVLVGESEASYRELLLPGYFEKGIPPSEWNRIAWPIYNTFKMIINLPGLELEQSLIRRMSAHYDNETFEKFNTGEVGNNSSQDLTEEEADWVGVPYELDLDTLDLKYNKRKRELTILDREKNVWPQNLDRQIVDYGLDGLDISRQIYDLLREGNVTSVGGVLLETRNDLLKILGSNVNLLAELEASVGRLLGRWR